MPKQTRQLQLYKFHAMGGPCTLHLYTKFDQADILPLVATEVLRIEKKYSRYREQSTLSLINRSAQHGIAVDTETAGLLNYAELAYKQSEGLFDITSGVLRLAWNFKSNKLPNKTRLQDILQYVGWEKIHWNGEILTMHENMQIDFGGIGKEYAVDAAIKICHQHGIKHGLIDLGGDLGVVGTHPDNTPWKIGIRHPRQTNTTFSTVDLYTGALASSGDYERYIIVDEQRYCHIFNPLTGYPTQGVASVSVQAEQCLVAGTAATIAMLKGIKPGCDWLNDLGAPYLLIDDQMKAYKNV